MAWRLYGAGGVGQVALLPKSCDRLRLRVERNTEMINRRIIVATLTGLLAVAGAQGLRGQAAGPAAPAGRTQDDSVSRLEPSAFKDLPAEVREELERRKCLVPQTYEARQPENVISGKFRDGDDRDWAVLCSREGTR